MKIYTSVSNDLGNSSIREALSLPGLGDASFSYHMWWTPHPPTTSQEWAVVRGWVCASAACATTSLCWLFPPSTLCLSARLRPFSVPWSIPSALLCLVSPTEAPLFRAPCLAPQNALPALRLLWNFTGQAWVPSLLPPPPSPRG